MLQSCSNDFDYSNSDAITCRICKEHFDTDFRLEYEWMPLKTRGNEIAVDGPDWDKLARAKFGSVSRIKMCRYGKYKDFKNHIYCYIGIDSEQMRRIIPRETIRKESTTTTEKKWEIELEIGKAVNYPEIVWNGTWKREMRFIKQGSGYKFVGNTKEHETLEKCLNDEFKEEY